MNAISDLLSTAAIQVSLSIEPSSGSIKKLIGNPHHDSASWGAKIQVGSVKFGQPRDFLVELPLPDDHNAEYLTATLNFVDPFTRESGEITADGNARNVSEKDTLTHLFRLKAVDAIRAAFKLCEDNPGSKDAAKGLAELIEEISKSSIVEDEYIVGLLEDLKGQATEAVSRSDYFGKWGRHYLPSLSRAHLLQYCNNFKDPGVQHYGGTPALLCANYFRYLVQRAPRRYRRDLLGSPATNSYSKVIFVRLWIQL